MRTYTGGKGKSKDDGGEFRGPIIMFRFSYPRSLRIQRSRRENIFNPDYALEIFVNSKVLKTKEIHQKFSNA